MMRFVTLFIFAVGLLLQTRGAGAFPGLNDVVIAQYPAATNLESCGTCHTSFTSASGLNPYGVDFATAGGLSDPAAAMVAIEGDDSDGDLSTNLEEIVSGAGFFPGWTCETYTSAQNPPGNLVDLVDPLDPGCIGVTTTSTTTSSTTTTLPGEEACSQPISSGPTPVATDCLFILQAAVGSQTCSPECVCAPTGTLPPKATDALLCLRHSVGDDSVPLQCPC